MKWLIVAGAFCVVVGWGIAARRSRRRAADAADRRGWLAVTVTVLGAILWAVALVVIARAI